MFEDQNVAKEIGDPPGRSSKLIWTERLGKSFGSHEVLRNVSIEVAKGEVVSVIGPSGSGKSTLLRCLALLETPTTGEIFMDGELIASAGRERKIKRRIRRKRPEIGMVFQNFNLWPHRTALGNIIEAPIRVKGLPRHEAIRLGEELLRKVGLLDKRDQYPAKLSGGQQQRVAIARALAMSPRLMLFDEVTSALDPELVQEVLRVMRQLAEDGTTMLVVTHEMAFAREVCHRVVFMSDAEVVEQGSPGQVFKNPQHERTQRFLSRVLDPVGLM